jgi:hypothetical protein
MLWHASTGPQRPMPRGGKPCPTVGTSYHRALDEQLNPVRWRT